VVRKFGVHHARLDSRHTNELPTQSLSQQLGKLSEALVAEWTWNPSRTRTAAIDDVVIKSALRPAAAAASRGRTKAWIVFMTPFTLRPI
jgi:hypothetical protein